jgi:hypothetical protein
LSGAEHVITDGKESVREAQAVVIAKQGRQWFSDWSAEGYFKTVELPD